MVELSGTVQQDSQQDTQRTSVSLVREYPLEDWGLWKFLTERDHVKQWFPNEYTFEPWDGGTLVFHDKYDLDTEGGAVLQYEAPHYFSFTWGENEVNYEVETLESGGVRFTLTDTLANANEAARNAAGWELCIANLDALVAEQQPTAFSWDRWKEFYAAYQGQGFPTGAVVPGLETHDEAGTGESSESEN